MKTRLTSAVVLVVLAVTGMVYTIAVGNRPLLGLDLQGGVSVVLQPKFDQPQELELSEIEQNVPEELQITGDIDEVLDQAVEIIRSRVDALGVAEPEISRQGNNIVVDLPGVDEQQRALELIGQTAEMRFRPVLLGPDDMFQLQMASAAEAAGVSADTELDGSDAATEDTDEPESDSIDSDSDDEQSLLPIRNRQTDDTTDDATDATTDGDESEAEATDEDSVEDDAVSEAPIIETPALESAGLSTMQVAAFEACGDAVPYTAEEDLADAIVVLVEPATGGLYCLGPTLLTGAALESAQAGFDGQTWTVNPKFLAGEEGIDAFNAVAAICAQPSVGNNSEICPAPNGGSQGRLAIVLDHEVISAPTINVPSFSRDAVQISGSFDEDSARNLALALNYGALGVELEAQQVQTVSATIGDDVLRSGIIAGIIGLVLVAIYVLAYYRLAGLVAIGGLLISGMLLWTTVAWLGESKGLAITLAGIVGLIVSIGVSADSNIVYFENVKDTVASGKRVATSVERAYESAISTILKADCVSLIAAGLLYFLTVGAVRGFALYLGLATFLDLLVSYLFMRPALAWLAGLDRVKKNPALLGVPVGEES